MISGQTGGIDFPPIIVDLKYFAVDLCFDIRSKFQIYIFYVKIVCLGFILGFFIIILFFGGILNYKITLNIEATKQTFALDRILQELSIVLSVSQSFLVKLKLCFQLDFKHNNIVGGHL